LCAYLEHLSPLQGSLAAPFDRHLNANDAENWEVQYVRKLVRDVKTVSKGVMVVTASAIGGELLFEGEPLDNTVYSKVRNGLPLCQPRTMRCNGLWTGGPDEFSLWSLGEVEDHV
jgi:hypothetical protein